MLLHLPPFRIRVASQPCTGIGVSILELLEYFIIPLCPNELRILNSYRVCSICEIPASFDSAGTSPSLPGALSCAGDINKCRKSAVRTILIANFCYFRVFWPYFRINSVDKSCRKAIINYLRKSNTKIDENQQKLAVVEYFW